MDLQELLKKTKAKKAKMETPQSGILPTIATQDRPYEVVEETSTLSTIKMAPKLHQTSTKPASNSHQSDSKVASRKQETGTATSIVTGIKVAPKLHQTGIKVAPTESVSFYELVGLQRALLLIIYRRCVEQRSEASGRMSLEFLSTNVGTTKRATKVALQRLQKKGFLETVEFKNGRGGWTNYRLPKLTYQEVLNAESDTKVASNLHQSGTKLPSQPASQLAPRSLEEEDSYIINKSSSSGSNQLAQTPKPLPTEWMEINFSELTALNIPFGQNHLRQIHATARVSAQELQESINHYAYDLRVTPGRKVAVQNHLGYFLNSLKNGPYAPPKGYKSPTEIARENYAASKREEAARLEKLSSEIFESEYSIWWNKLSLEEQKKITTNDGIRGKVESQRFFKDSVWPTRIKEINV
jgi:hypothetical protein